MIVALTLAVQERPIIRVRCTKYVGLPPDLMEREERGRGKEQQVPATLSFTTPESIHLELVRICPGEQNTRHDLAMFGENHRLRLGHWWVPRFRLRND